MEKNTYIIKWKVQDITGNWVYRYMGGFTFTLNEFEYEAKWYQEGCLKYPKGVAEWLCWLLELEGKTAIMEKVD